MIEPGKYRTRDGSAAEVFAVADGRAWGRTLAISTRWRSLDWNAATGRFLDARETCSDLDQRTGDLES